MKLVRKILTATIGLILTTFFSSPASAQWVSGPGTQTTSDSVGIGVTPGIPLEIQKNGLTLAGTFQYNARVGDSTGTRGFVLGYDTSGTIGVVAPVGVSGQLAFWNHNGTSFGERMRLNSQGNLLIGTTIDNGRLSVQASSGTAINAQTLSGFAINATSTDQNGIGVYGKSDASGAIAVWGSSTSGIGGYFSSSNGVAGFFVGNAHVTGNLSVGGTLSKAAGSFKIDHPLDPENKYLYHSFVESPDMKNIYDGNALLDANGEAIIAMPEWFEALNKDFRYQLTSIGAPGPNLYVAQEINGNHFKVAGGKPGSKVSWMVTGVRHDAYADAHRIPVEEDKSNEERGYYLHPTEHKQPEQMGIEFRRQQERVASRPRPMMQ